MGVFILSSSTWRIHFLFVFFVFLVPPSFGENDFMTSKSSPAPPPPPPPPPPPLPLEEEPESSAFRPSIAVVVGVLTSLFSITFLLLLYAKHCKHGSVVVYSNHNGGGGGLPPSAVSRNSGIDRVIVESLPLFRFGSLRGQKDGLECAVCLARFNPTEVLRLLPKCKHAFHVECVDTWLDSHSTCPLCRYRVDPEDILLLHDVNILHNQTQLQRQQSLPQGEDNPGLATDRPSPGQNPVVFHRISGRHSSAGEASSSRVGSNTTPVCRWSLDSAKTMNEFVTVGCFDRPRKDGLLLTDADQAVQRRLEHRIIVSAGGGFQERWSDVHPSDLLYLRSEMIISDSRRFSLGSSRPSVKKQQPDTNIIEIGNSNNSNSDNNNSGSVSGSDVINARSVSEITGLSRFSGRERKKRNHRQRHEGLVSRWLAWRSSSAHPHVPPSDPHAHTSNVV